MITISPTEKEIMEVLWLSEGMTNNEIMIYFNNRNKNWARQTTHTFLSRMVKKGLLNRENHRYYTAYSKQQLENEIAQGILDIMYNNSLTNFIAALSNSGEKLAEEEIEKLKQMIDTME